MMRESRRGFQSAASLLSVAILVVVWLAGCATTSSGPPDPNADPGAGAPSGGASTGPTASQRVQSAVEGMLMGAIIGSQAGPIGAAVGAGTLLIYSAITGQVPLQGSGRPSHPGRSEAEREEELERQIESEIARQDSLEAEIEAELQRQEELLREIERDEALRTDGTATEDGDDEETLVARADPRAAPVAPKERDLPLSIFDEEQRTVAKGKWGNDKQIDVVARSLDADRDGNPEEVRYHDSATGRIIRKEEDKNYDGTIDTWSNYESGVLAEILKDNNEDGEADEWHRYGPDGRMATREVDRDYDGQRDAFFVYEGGSLAEERHDGNSDGSVDRIVRYQQRAIVSTEEDRNQDGRMDTWTSFETIGGKEVIVRIEKDTSGDGKPDTFETYEQIAGTPTIKQRDEDKNGDGTIDIRSVYENGKLKQREISDPALVPL
jgi:antitoxin component YwqK of YwqJK toxin-antitoxin module